VVVIHEVVGRPHLGTQDAAGLLVHPEREPDAVRVAAVTAEGRYHRDRHARYGPGSQDARVDERLEGVPHEVGHRGKRAPGLEPAAVPAGPSLRRASCPATATAVRHRHTTCAATSGAAARTRTHCGNLTAPRPPGSCAARSSPRPPTWPARFRSWPAGMAARRPPSRPPGPRRPPPAVPRLGGPRFRCGMARRTMKAPASGPALGCAPWP